MLLPFPINLESRFVLTFKCFHSLKASPDWLTRLQMLTKNCSSYYDKPKTAKIIKEDRRRTYRLHQDDFCQHLWILRFTLSPNEATWQQASLSWVGHHTTPLSSDDVAGNHFILSVRCISSHAKKLNQRFHKQKHHNNQVHLKVIRANSFCPLQTVKIGTENYMNQGIVRMISSKHLTTLKEQK